MIATVKRLTDFLKKHKKKKSSSLWAMACPKQKTVREINDKIRSQKYGFSGRITKIIDGRMMTFYKEWEDRFVDFCLYRHLTELAIQKKLISPNYMSFKGRGRCHAIRCLLHQRKNFDYVFKTDIKSYFESMNTVILEKIIHRSGIPDPLHHLIWQDLFYGNHQNRSQFRKKSIFQGSSISSYYAWIYLKNLDDFFDKEDGCYYQRYKDDIIILNRSIRDLSKTQDIIYSILRKKGNCSPPLRPLALA